MKILGEMFEVGRKFVGVAPPRSATFSGADAPVVARHLPSLSKHPGAAPGHNTCSLCSIIHHFVAERLSDPKRESNPRFFPLSQYKKMLL